MQAIPVLPRDPWSVEVARLEAKVAAYRATTPDFQTKDSGQRQEFASGMVRDVSEGKGRHDLLPPRAMHRVAGVYERGAKKYAARNWEQGAPASRFMESAIRHIFQRLEGKTDEDHLGHAVFNLLAIMEFEERAKSNAHYNQFLDLPQP